MDFFLVGFRVFQIRIPGIEPHAPVQISANSPLILYIVNFGLFINKEASQLLWFVDEWKTYLLGSFQMRGRHLPV